MELGLGGKRALVTASSGGIGEAIARMLAAEGAIVVLNGRNEATLAETARRIRFEVPEAELEMLEADLGTDTGCETAIRDFPEIDILVNNLGIYAQADFFDISDEQWFRLLEVNVLSGIRLARHYLKRMIAQNDGRIIFISSECAVNPAPEMVHYSATKTMQMAVSRNLAELTKGSRVTVNAILPGPVATPGAVDYIGQIFSGQSQAEAEQRFMAENRSTSLIQRLAHCDEVASFVAFLSSYRAASINGAALRIDGGIFRSIF